MLLQSVIGRIGRKKRYECAQFISQMLTKELADNPASDSVRVTVTKPEFLDAFRTRRFGRSTDQLLRKFDQRVRINLQNQPFLVRTHGTTEEGVVTSLQATADRIGTPRG